MSESLYQRVKECLPPQKFMVSERDSIILNMRDFHINQISAVHATLQVFGLNIGYPFRVLLSFLDAFAQGINGKDFNIVLADPSMGVAAYHVWLRAGGSDTVGKIYAPRGMPKLPKATGLMADICRDFEIATDSSPDSKPGTDRRDMFTFVIGNTKSAEATLFAVDRFKEVAQGLLLLKDYAKGDAFDEREYLEKLQIFPAVTYEGHAFVVRF